MIVAEVFVATGRFHYEQKHVVPFHDLEKAKAEYDRVAAIITKRNERGNDLPKTIEIDGDAGHKVSVGTDDIATLGLVDFVRANDQRRGVMETYPSLFVR